jgi:diguanylate cyclase (GGDEF)-like protein
VARLGGDEFVVLSEQLSAPADALTVADKVQAALAPPLNLSGQTVTVGASVGISLYPEDGTDADTLLRKADTAMYDAKRAGGRRVCLYGEQLSAAAAGEGSGFAGRGGGR